MGKLILQLRYEAEMDKDLFEAVEKTISGLIEKEDFEGLLKEVGDSGKIIAGFYLTDDGFLNHIATRKVEDE